MTARVQTLRSSVKQQRPTGRATGELYVNFADLQLGVITPTAAQDLLAIRHFSASTDYRIGDHVVQAGVLYRARTDIAAAPFNITQWQELLVGPPAGGGTTSTYVGDTPPTAPVDGDTWWESDSGKFFVWFTDADGGQQWVETASGKAGGVAVASLASLKTIVPWTGATVIYDGSIWVWTTGNYSAQITADTTSALFVKADSQAATAGAWLRQYEGGAKARWFGVRTTGNSYTALQRGLTMLATLGGGILEMDAGTFLVQGNVSIGSNVRLRGAGRGATTLTCGATSGDWFAFTGSFGAEIKIGGDYGRNDSVLSTATAHGLAANNIVLIKSQRSCNSVEATDEWRLSGDNQQQYFGEFLVVASVNADVGFTSLSPLIFPSYRDDKTLDASSGRDSATIQKMSPLRNGAISDMTLITGAGVGVLVRGYAAHKCRVERINFVMGIYDGMAAYFDLSLFCEVVDCHAHHEVTAPIVAADNYKFNDYKMVSSQSCGFTRCISENGSQCFDLTFNTDSIPYVNCFIRDCIGTGARLNAATSHPGGYGSSITGNRFTEIGVNTPPDGAGGIAVRCRASVVTNNVIIAARAGIVGGYGIALAEGWARDSVVANNFVEGFESGITVRDSAPPAAFTQIGCVIANNVIRHAKYGIRRSVSGTTAAGILSKLVIKGNVMSFCGEAYVYIENPTDGVVVDGNTGFGPCDSGFYIAASNYAVMSNNVTNDIGSASIPFWITNACSIWSATGNVSNGAAARPVYPALGSSRMHWNNGTGSASLYIPDDVARGYAVTGNHVTITVSGYPAQANGCATIRGGVATKNWGLSGFACVATALDGNDGADGGFTVGFDAAAGLIYFENRTGADDTFSVIVQTSVG